jgi:hypothetical protein
VPRAEDRNSFDERAIGCGGRPIRQEPAKSVGDPPPEALFAQGTKPDSRGCPVGLLSGVRVNLASGDEREQFSQQFLAALAAMDGAHGNGSFWQMVRAG